MIGNYNNSNSFIWLILLILIFFSDNSSTIGIGNYYKLSRPTTLFDGLI